MGPTSTQAASGPLQGGGSCQRDDVAGAVPELPAPLYLTGRFAGIAARASAATCLHGERLRGAVLSSSGFAFTPGRKPGFLATRAGSSIVLRLSLPHGLASTPVHLGYLHSWRPRMARAAVSCDAPCECAALLDGYKTGGENVSVTKMSIVELRGPRGNGTSCSVRLRVERGRAGGGRFFLTDLISGSSDPGVVRWVFGQGGGENLLKES